MLRGNLASGIGSNGTPMIGPDMFGKAALSPFAWRGREPVRLSHRSAVSRLIAVVRFCLPAFLCICWAVLGLAQEAATLSGTVADISGAVIPGATISARSVMTGSETKVATDSEGGFRFAPLPPGEYLVSCAARGFSPAQQRTVVGPSTPILRFTLNVAGASETVAV